MTDKTREAFEAWFTANRGAGMLGKSETGNYEWVNTSDAWEVCQAATLAERERCALVCEGRVYALDHAGKQYRREWTASQCAADIRKGGEA